MKQKVCFILMIISLPVSHLYAKFTAKEERFMRTQRDARKKEEQVEKKPLQGIAKRHKTVIDSRIAEVQRKMEKRARLAAACQQELRDRKATIACTRAILVSSSLWLALRSEWFASELS